MTWNQIGGYFDYQTYYDRLIALIPDDGVFVEVGSLYGRSLAYFGQMSMRAGKGIRLHAVDAGIGVGQLAPFGHHISTLRRNLNACGIFHAQIHNAYSVDAARSFPVASADAVFLDAGHTEADIAADIAAWLPVVRPGGILAGHDYDHPHYPDVKRVVDARFGPSPSVCPSCWEHRV